MQRILAIPGALVVLLIGALFWSGGNSDKRAEFAFINRGDIFTLDLNTMSYMQDFRLTYGIREGLYGVDGKTFKPTPGGAVSHDLSADKKVWTFHLRKDARWSNGDPITARDYVFSWRRMLEEPGEYSYLFYYILNMQKYGDSYAKGESIGWDQVGVKAKDDFTLEVTLANPVSYLLELVAFPPFYPRHERSMTAQSKDKVFRQYIDGEDLMDPFVAYVKAAGKVNAALPAEQLAKDLAREAGFADQVLLPAGVSEFVKAAKDFQEWRATEEEVLGVLKPFATMNPFDGIKGTGVKTPEDSFSGLSPKEKLAKMLEKQFVRHVYSKEYTRPPYVVTNGPFVLTDWDFHRRLLLTRSDTYWDKANVKSPTIEMVVAETPQSQLLLYETGKVDWLSEVTGEQAAELKAKNRKDLRISPAFGTMFLTMLCKPNLPKSLGGGKNPLADVRVRQALAMTVDKRFIVDNVTRMEELPARTYLPPDGTLPDFMWNAGPFDKGAKAGGSYGFEELQGRLKSPDGLTGDGPGLPYNVQKARELLAAAGYANGANFPQLPILYNTSSDARRQIAQVLKDQWKRALNIDVSIQAVEGKIFSRNVTERDYWIATVAWYGDYPDVSTFTDKYTSTSINNDAAWENKTFDKLCEDAAAEPDAKKRAALLSAAEHMIDTEAPIVPIYHYVNVSMNRDEVKGVLPNPRNITIFKDVYVEPKR